jgi:hypothetical protein
MLSRGCTNHARRHCVERATLPAQLAAVRASDASASASDENSAALELHEPIVPLALERAPGSRLMHEVSDLQAACGMEPTVCEFMR